MSDLVVKLTNEGQPYVATYCLDALIGASLYIREFVEMKFSFNSSDVTQLAKVSTMEPTLH